MYQVIKINVWKHQCSTKMLEIIHQAMYKQQDQMHTEQNRPMYAIQKE